MAKNRKSQFRLAVFMLILVMLAVAGYAFAANNTVPANNAGDGSEQISGYMISAVSYDLDATDPSVIDGVSFSISPANAKTVKIQLTNGGQWFSCNNSGGSVSCAINGAVSALEADILRVVAAQ